MLQKVYTTQYNAIQQVFVLKMFNVHLTHIELTAIVLRTFRINYLQKTNLVGKLTTVMTVIFVQLQYYITFLTFKLTQKKILEILIS